MSEELKEILSRLREDLSLSSESASALDESSGLNAAMEWANSYHHRFERAERLMTEAEKSLGKLLKDSDVRGDRDVRTVLIRMLGVSSAAANDLKNLIAQCESLMKGETDLVIR